MTAAESGFRAATPAWRGLSLVGLWLAGGLATGIPSPGPLGAQTLEGVVRTADGGEGLAGATVRQEFEEGRFQAVRTEATGDFRLTLEGEPPYRIRVQRLGFGESVQTLEGVPDGPLDVVLERRPVQLDGITAEVEREPIRIDLPEWRVLITEEGLYRTSIKRSHDNCSYLAIDDVVIRHPEDLHYYFTSLRGSGVLVPGRMRDPYLLNDHHQNSTIPDSRLRRESNPCALQFFGGTSEYIRHTLPEVDLPAKPAATLTPRWEQALPAPPQAVAPSPGGGLSVWLDGRIVHLDGDTVFAVERPAPNVRIDSATVDRISEEIGSHPDLQAALPFSGFETLLVSGSLYRPPFHPATSDVLVGTDGRTWLRGIDDGVGSVRWEVLGTDGELEAVLDLDRTIRLIAADQDGAWGLDASGDTPHLVRYASEPIS